jgi:hypothetical protein
MRTSGSRVPDVSLRTREPQPRYIPGVPPGYPHEVQPCDECGTILESGTEPNSPQDDLEAWQEGQTEIGVDWCPNLDCPSNHVLSSLTRGGMNRYVCTVCGTELTGPMSRIFGHRRTH